MMRFMVFLVSATLMIASSALAAETLRIGALFSVTGPASFLGEPERNTLEMLVKEANAKGGLKGHKLELVVYDTQGDATVFLSSLASGFHHTSKTPAN